MGSDSLVLGFTMSAYHLSALLVAWAVLRWSRHRSLFPPLIVCCVISIIGISLTHSLTLHLSNYLSLSLSLTRSPSSSDYLSLLLSLCLAIDSSTDCPIYTATDWLTRLIGLDWIGFLIYFCVAHPWAVFVSRVIVGAGSSTNLSIDAWTIDSIGLTLTTTSLDYCDRYDYIIVRVSPSSSDAGGS